MTNSFGWAARVREGYGSPTFKGINLNKTTVMVLQPIDRLMTSTKFNNSMWKNLLSNNSSRECSTSRKGIDDPFIFTAYVYDCVSVLMKAALLLMSSGLNPEDGAAYFSSILNTTLSESDAITGEISFNRTSGDRINGAYEISLWRDDNWNLIFPFTTQLYGNTSENLLIDQLKASIFPHGNVPPGVYEEFIFYRSLAAIAIIIFVCLNLILIAISAIILGVKQPISKVLKGSNPIGLGLILIGLILCYVSLFGWIGKPDLSLCLLRIWPNSIGIFIIYGLLFLRTWSFYKAFLSNSSKYLSEIALAYYLCGLIGFIAIYLTLWTVIDRYTSGTSVFNDSGYAKYYVCTSNWSGWVILNLCFMGILFLGNAFLSLYLRIKKFKIYNNEPQFIALINLLNMIVYVIALGLWLKLHNSSTSSSFIIIAITFILCGTFIWVFLFLPKFYAVFADPTDLELKPVLDVNSGSE